MEEDLYDTPWEFKNKTFAENIAVIEAATANTSNLIIPTKISSKHNNNKRMSECNSLSISSSTNSSPILNNNEKKFSTKITKENFNNNCFNNDNKFKTNVEKGSPKSCEKRLNDDMVNCDISKNILATVVPVNVEKDTKKIFHNNCNVPSKNPKRNDDCKKDKISNRIDYKLAIDNGTCLLKDDLKYGSNHNIQRKQETSNDTKSPTSINSNPSSPFEVVMVTRQSSTSPLNNQSPKASIKEKLSPLSRHTTILTTKPSSPKHHKQPTSYHRSSHSDTIDIPNLENTCNNQPSSIAQGQKSSTNKYNSHLVKKNKIDTEDMIIHNNVDRTIAEMILQNKDTGYFLLRKRSEGNMAMSLKGNSGILHIKLEQRSGKWILGEGPTFSSISSVIKYYRNHELPIRGADHIILRNPILVQMDDGRFFC